VTKQRRGFSKAFTMTALTLVGVDLPAREFEVPRLVQEGLRNKQIAEQMGISENTVKSIWRAFFGGQGLMRQNEELEEAVAARTCELAEANEKLTILDDSKNAFLTLISHEFRTPLHGLLGVGELILERMTSTDEDRQLQGLFQRCRRSLLSLLDDALLVTQIDVNPNSALGRRISHDFR
jgi:signal transduction histidine kinase